MLAILLIKPTVGSFIKNNIAQAYKIPAGSMLNTLRVGDYIMCDKRIYKKVKPGRGDIVIFPSPKDPAIDYTKRIIGLGGESIEIKDKKVFIDGSPLDEPYVINTSEKILANATSPRDNFGPFTIPDDSVFVMGDNRDNSHDSRFWGAIKTSSLKGKITSVYWSWDSENSNVRWERIGKKVK